MFYFKIIFIILSISISVVFGSQKCQDEVVALELAFEAYNVDLMNWELDSNCNSSYQYSNYYIKGKTGFYTEQDSLARMYLDKAIEIGGAHDQEIYFLITELDAKEGRETNFEKYYQKMEDSRAFSAYMEELGIGDDGASQTKKTKSWSLKVSNKTKVTNIENNPNGTMSKVAFKVTQSIGDLRLLESISGSWGTDFSRVKANDLPTLIDDWGVTLGVTGLYKQTILSIGYNLNYHYSFYDTTFSERFNYKSFYGMFSQSFVITPNWRLSFNAMGYQVDPSWILSIISHSQTVKIGKSSVYGELSYEKSFLSDLDASYSDTVLADIQAISTNLEWRRSVYGHEIGIGIDNSFEVEIDEDVSSDGNFSDYQWNYLHLGYLMFNPKITDCFSIQSKWYWGQEERSHQWNSVYKFQLGLTLSI